MFLLQMVISAHYRKTARPGPTMLSAGPVSVAPGLDGDTAKIFDGSYLPKSGAAFSYTVLPSVTAVSPVFGSRYGGTVGTVYVSGFSRSEKIYCRYGDGVIVTGGWLSSSKLNCVTTAMSPGNFTVEVSSNGKVKTIS